MHNVAMVLALALALALVEVLILWQKLQSERRYAKVLEKLTNAALQVANNAVAFRDVLVESGVVQEAGEPEAEADAG